MSANVFINGRRGGKVWSYRAYVWKRAEAGVPVKISAGVARMPAGEGKKMYNFFVNGIEP